MTNHEIDSLIKRIASGDSRALEILYEGMSKPVYFYALRLVGTPEAAEDVMQDTFVSIMHGSGSYRQSEKGTSWIFTIAKNKALDLLRKEGRNLSFDETGELPDKDNEIEKAVSNISFMQMLAPLNSEEREIVILRLFGDMTLTQVSRELNLPKGTVFWKYNNAIKKLKVLYEGGKSDEKQI